MPSDPFKNCRLQLDKLRRKTEADILTCYIKNPFSGMYWLLHTSTNRPGLKYPWFMHGPITHPDQEKRFTLDEVSLRQDNGLEFISNASSASRLEVHAARITKKSKTLSMPVLAGQSFTVREGIKTVVRIAFNGAGDASKKFIFLNYRKVQTSTKIKRTIKKLSKEISALSKPLHIAAYQPRLSKAVAWHLRSINIRLREYLGHVIKKEDDAALFKDIPKWCLRILAAHPKRTASKDKTIKYWCTFSLVSKNNEVTFTTQHPHYNESIDSNRTGIVHCVAYTGRICLLNNIHDYRRQLKNTRSRKDPYIFPDYYPAWPEARSELACPLIVQGKVVGVLNVEANQTNAFDDEDALVLFQFCSSVALAIRQQSLWNDIVEIFTLKTTLQTSANEHAICVTACTLLRGFGYEDPGIALIDAGGKYEWAPSFMGTGNTTPTVRQLPRPGGFTDLVRKGHPIAISDIVQLVNGPTCSVSYSTCHLGKCDKQSKLFIKWEKYDDRNIPVANVHPQIVKIVKSRKGSPPVVLSDLGFPIFDSQDNVCAVLWVKTWRYMRLILDDECWCLSLVANIVGEALQASRSKMAIVSSRVRHHFGNHFTQTELDNIHNGKMQDSQPRAIIVELDWRKSTQLVNSWKEEIEPSSKLRDIISHYHEISNEKIVKSGGIYDQHAGDGIHAYYNLILKGTIITEKDTTNLGIEFQHCVETCFSIFAETGDCIARTKFTIPKDFHFAAGLAIQDIYVTWPPESKRTGMFTGIGTGLSFARRLVNLARLKDINERVKISNGSVAVNQWSGSEWKPVSASDVKDKLISVKEYKLLGSRGIVLIDGEATEFLDRTMAAKYDIFQSSDPSNTLFDFEMSYSVIPPIIILPKTT